MPNFNYTAIDKQGKNTKGVVEAVDEEQALIKIRAQGLMVMEIKPEDIWNKEIKIGGSGVKPRDLSVFCRQFVSMINAGVTIIDALGMLAESTDNKTLAKNIRGVQTDIEKGDSLSDAMTRRSDVFPEMLINMVAAGESSGDIETSFERMAAHFEKEAHLKSLITKAAVYPIVVAIVAVAVVVVMLVAVIPAYKEMFADMGTELPAITQVVVAMSEGLQQYWYIIVLVIVIIVVAIMMFKRTPNGRLLFGKIGYKAPIFGNLTVKTAASLFARTMSTMIAAGIPMMEAINNVSKIMGNVLFRDALENAKEEVAKGEPLSNPIERCGLFPPMVHHMIRIGEETGDIESMLDRLADYYDEEVEMATQTVMAAIEPMIIIVLAVVVGGILAAVFSPMLKMYNDMGSLM